MSIWMWGPQSPGNGGIGDLVVNAPGSNVSMLPDQIVIRPGDTANINGENMDSEAAAESSADPRLLSGYPKITDLAPSSATAQFSGNKRGDRVLGCHLGDRWFGGNG